MDIHGNPVGEDCAPNARINLKRGYYAGRNRRKKKMEMVFKVSDMELMNKADKLLKYEDYIQTREKYRIRNPKKYVNADVHFRIMQEATKIAKGLIFRGGTDEEIRNACIYLYICVDSRKYRLFWGKARKDLKIDELVKKYSL